MRRSGTKGQQGKEWNFMYKLYIRYNVMLYSEWWELSSFFIQRLKIALLIYKGAELQPCVEPVPSCLGSAHFPASTSFKFKSDPKIELDTHRTDPCGVMGAKDCPQAGWLLVGLSPGIVASLQPGPEGLRRIQTGMAWLSRAQHNQRIPEIRQDDVQTSHPPAQNPAFPKPPGKKSKGSSSAGKGLSAAHASISHGI